MQNGFYLISRALFSVLVLGLISFAVYNFFIMKKPTPVFNSPVSSYKGDETTSVGQIAKIEPQSNSVRSQQTATTNSSGLSKVVSNALEGTQGTYAIVIKNLKTGESFEQNPHMILPPASMYKLWVMTVAYKQVEEGTLTMDTKMARNVADLNRLFKISDEDAELTEGGFTFTVAEALERMITVSHNYAAYMLTEKIGLKSIAPFLRNYGLLESKVGVNGNLPTSSAADMKLYFEMLYGGKLAGTQATAEMITLLKKQQFKYALPKYVPEEVQMAHKTGNIDEYTHDGGIVYGTKGDYIIVVMTKSNNPEAAEERMALVSKAVWEYFEK